MPIANVGMPRSTVLKLSFVLIKISATHTRKMIAGANDTFMIFRHFWPIRFANRVRIAF